MQEVRGGALGPPLCFHEPTSPTIHMPNAERTEPSSIQLNIPGNRPWITSLLSWRPKRPLQRGNRVSHSLPETPPDDPLNSPVIVAPPEAHEVHPRASEFAQYHSSMDAEDAVPDSPTAITTATPWLSGVSHFKYLRCKS